MSADSIIGRREIAVRIGNLATLSFSARFQRLTGGTERGYATQPSASHALGVNLLAHEPPSQVTQLLQGWRGGGGGAAAVQIGKLLGIDMYGTSSSDEKLARV
jgi:hypothetical protein